MNDLTSRQKGFYEVPHSSRRYGIGMRIWISARRPMYTLMREAGIAERVASLQKEWMGDLSGKKVLDFGCYEGNQLSHYLAAHAGSYYGIDLSEPAIDRLRRSLYEAGIPSATLSAVDILSPSFQEGDFDVVYAQGVLHHFRDVEVILKNLYDRLKPGGIVVSGGDPMRTSVLTSALRAVFRPFQQNRDWEWPFSRSTFRVIQNFFDIQCVQGYMGAAKWAIPLAHLSKARALKAVRKWSEQDFNEAKSTDKHLWKCLQVSLKLRRPDRARRCP